VATGQVVQTIWNLYNGPAENSASAVERYSTWQQVKDSMANNDRLLGLLLALFGIIALLAAPCAIANVTAGRVLVQRQDIAMLKALGFTPGQVVRMLLAEQTLRDERDTGREHSPLAPASGAVMLDTTGLTVDEVVGHIAALAAGHRTSSRA